MENQHLNPQFIEFCRLPVPVVAGDLPESDTRVMSLKAASLYFKRTKEELEKWWICVVSASLKMDMTIIAHDAGDANRPSADRLKNYRILRGSGYSELTDAECDALLIFCSTRKLNPVAKHVYPTWRRDQDGARIIEFRLTVDGMWEIARQAGGLMKHTTKHVRDARGWPLRTIVFVWRKSADGEVIRYRAEVEFAGRYPGPGKSEIWDKDPWRMNEKNAEVAALRKAYPEQLGGIYSIDEPGYNPVRLAGVDAAIQRRDLSMDPYLRRPWPLTLREFELALYEYQLRDPEKRKLVINTLHAELPDMSGPAFYRQAMRLVQADPGRYGAKLPTPEDLAA